MQQLVCGRGRCFQTDMDAKVSSFLDQEEPDVGFTFDIRFGQAGLFFRPGAIMEQVEQLEFIQGLPIFLRRDWLAVDGCRNLG